jgi:Polysaccharide deacetylase
MTVKIRATLAACALAAGLAIVPDAAVGQAAPVPHGLPGFTNAGKAAGPFVTLLFSRTEVTAADGCVRDNTGIAQLVTTVAPYLQSLGMPATGTLVTGNIKARALLCTHSGDSLEGSWSDAAKLAADYGWSFVSHTATYPHDIGGLPPAQQRAETCGSAAAIDAHGLPGGHGMIAYPGAQASPTAVQAKYGAHCFAWGRKYGRSGITSATAGTTPPYWQYTRAIGGGACNTPGASCYTVFPHHYALPSTVIAEIRALQPGQWLTMQSYILVTGKSPPYAHNKTQWDCTSPNPALHWTNAIERYCYSDWQQIMRAIAAAPGIRVTDPLTVGVAFGRPATYPQPPGAIGPR